jgi:hypothetical protein
VNVTAIPLDTNPAAAGTPRVQQSMPGNAFEYLLFGHESGQPGDDDSASDVQASSTQELCERAVADATRHTEVQAHPDAHAHDSVARQLNARAGATELGCTAALVQLASLPSEVYPMTSAAVGRLSYVSRDRHIAEGRGHQTARCDAVPAARASSRPSQAAVISDSNAAIAGTSLPSGEACAALDAVEDDATGTADCAALVVTLREHLEAVMRRRISVRRGAEGFDILIRDYRLTDAERAALVRAVVALVAPDDPTALRITINGEDWSHLAGRHNFRMQANHAR